MLNVRQQSPVYIDSVIGDCNSFNVCFRSFNFLHVMRKGNQVGHYLAEYIFRNLNCI